MAVVFAARTDVEFGLPRRLRLRKAPSSKTSAQTTRRAGTGTTKYDEGLRVKE